MINRVFRLVAPGQIMETFIDEGGGDEELVVRPTYMSICHADQRYYRGERDKATLDAKLPMSLIHECVGHVVYDPKKEFAVGQSVVMIPNTPMEHDDVIRENYLRSSRFRSSGYDGFMQSLVFVRRDRVISYDGIDGRIAVLLEMLSVVMNALEHFESNSHARRERIGLWGNGSLGFMASLIIKKRYPDAKLAIIGPSGHKLQFFQFADELISLSDIPEGFMVDHAFECVGGSNSADAIDQIIDHINPQGSITLMGVSEQRVPINTRMVLEKGLNLLGNSRSSYEDFENSIKFLTEHDDAQGYLSDIISDEIDVRCLDDIHEAFNRDGVNSFKTVMKWGM